MTLAVVLPSAPANAVVLDLSTMTCKQFLEGGDDTIKMVLTWMDGWYKGDSDEAIIDTDVFVDNAKKFGTYCAKNPSISIVNAAAANLGKYYLHGRVFLHANRYPLRLKMLQDGSIAKALETIATGLLSVAEESVTRPKLMVRPSRTKNLAFSVTYIRNIV